MLNLGLHSWDILNSQVYREPFLDPQIITQFIPTLMSLIVDDQARTVNAKLPQDDRESALTTIEHSGPPPDLFQNYISNDKLATVLAVYYTFQVCRQKDKQAIMRVLGTLANSHENRALENPFLHNLVAYFIPLADEFATEDFCTVVLDELFLTALSQTNVAHHMMKLLYYVYTSLPSHRIEVLTKTLSSLQLTNEASKTLHRQLDDKLRTTTMDTGMQS
jgi:negative elongation factor B